MKLALGVVDVAYSDANSGGATTTAEVAKILEDRYHVMETFYESRKEKIDDWLASSVANAIEAMAEYGTNLMPTFNAEQKIEAEFRAFLDSNEMANLFASLTESERQYYMDSTGGFLGAAMRGVNHRKKKPYSSKNKARPAFIDSGLYRTSFRAWVVE